MIQSVSRALDILRALAAASRGMGVTEVADHLGVAKPTAFALLKTLERGALVSQDHETLKYRLGPALVELGNAYLETHELRARSVVWADSLATRAGEAVWVAVRSGDHVIIVHHAFRPEGAVQILEVGAAMPWHTSALGKAIVAHLPVPERDGLLAGKLSVLTGQTVTDPSELAQQLDRAVAVGYAIEDGEATIGDAGIAAPVHDRDGVIGAIGLVGPVERLLDDGPRDENAVAVRETARLLSRDMGARSSLRRVSADS